MSRKSPEVRSSPATLIIAEAGVNHNGRYELACRLIDAAASAGADCVKFQTFRTEMLVSPAAKKAPYQIHNSSAHAVADESQYNMLKELELDRPTHFRLMEHCRKRSIRFLSTPFDLESVRLLDELGLDTIKISSGDLTNLPLLEMVGGRKKQVILSTGMADLEETGLALKILVRSGTPLQNITLLHCNTQYPTPYEDVNLSAMATLTKKFGVAVGYSDHTTGIEVPIAAAALGARCIEKHFTLDRNMPGPDHRASLEPGELHAMVKGIRHIELALGNGIKKSTPSERQNLAAARKSIHLARAVKAGHQIAAADLIMLRPGDGISPMKIHTIIGKKTRNSLPAGHKLGVRDFR